MPNYIITQKAGPYVAGLRNTGVGTRLSLSERAAEHELRLGTLIEENADVLAPRAQSRPSTPSTKSAKSANDGDAKGSSALLPGENPTVTAKPSANPTADEMLTGDDKTTADDKPTAGDKSAADAVAS